MLFLALVIQIPARLISAPAPALLTPPRRLISADKNYA